MAAMAGAGVSPRVSLVPVTKIGSIVGVGQLQTVQQFVFPSRLRTSNSWTIGVVRAGDSFGTPCCSSSAPSSSPLQAIPTQTSHAAVTRYPNKVPSGSDVIAEDGNNRGAMDTLESFYKKNAKEEAKMKVWIEEIRGMFRSMTDGEISLSPYDTAWVARLPAIDGSKGPRFSKSVQWIIDNQLLDGSWGDAGFFSSFDRAINTVGCVVALKTWEMGTDSIERGVKFLQQNLQKMEAEEDAHMPIGFEIVFPTMMSDAQELGLDLPYDAPIILKIITEGQKKLNKCLPHSFPYNYVPTSSTWAKAKHSLVTTT